MSEEARKSEINQTGRAWVVAIAAIIADGTYDAITKNYFASSIYGG